MIQPIFKLLKLNFLTLTTSIAFVFISLVSIMTASCGTDSDAFYFAALGLNKGAIIVTSAPAATSYVVVKYSIEGEFEEILFDSTALGLIPRGVTLFDAFNLLVNFDGVDGISKVNIFTGEQSSFYSGALYNGNLYHIARKGNQTYAIETNNIEMFNGSARFPSAGNAYIPLTVGGCTLSTPRSLAFNSNGELIVASTASSRLFRYDVSTTTPTCPTNLNVTNQPIALMAHSNGNIYYATQTAADGVFSVPSNLGSAPTTILSGGIMNNPTALAELPDGSIIVANDGTDNIDRIDQTTGATIQSPFIKDGFTSLITDIMVIQPQ